MEFYEEKEENEHVPKGDIDDLIFDEYHTKEISEK